jgi:hypothetical protein
MSILRINAIRCIEQEDFWGDDDTFIVVNGQRVWGPQPMDEGQTRTINAEFAFNRSVEIKLFEVDDLDPDDFLGQVELRATDEGEHHLKFTEDDADYSLWVTIVNTKVSVVPRSRTREETIALADANVFTQPEGIVGPVGAFVGPERRRTRR